MENESIKLARKIPEYVVKAFYAIRKEYPLDWLFANVPNMDGITLGKLCLALHGADETVINYLSTADGGLIDGDKLELSIIALSLAYEEGKYKLDK